MRKIVDYCVVENEDDDRLRDNIFELLKEGYQLQGGISVCFGHEDDMKDRFFWYSQAMVKYEDDN